MTAYASLEEMIVATAEAVRPAERLTVSESAAKYRWLNNSGSYVGLWLNSKTPYLVEPMDTFTSLDYTAVAFVGPARTGKSDMFFNWLEHTARTDPADMMTVMMTQNAARDWSQGDLTKAFYHEGNKNRPTELGERLVPGRQNDNVHDKKFLSGMRLLIKWPTISELSGKTIPRLWINDYDRMSQNVDGEGNPFDLTRKRAQTFKRYGMTVAESSPGFPVTNSKWLANGHEAPPCEGILSVYNRGDRRRWFWQCPQCKESFEPDFKLLNYPASADPMESAEAVTLVCPHDGYPMTPDMQSELNSGGRWLKEGQFWLPDNSIVGTARRSDIASFWMKGPAAAFTDWPSLVRNYLNAMDDFERTGSEEALKVTTNVDQGLPYTPKSIEAGRLPEELKNRAEHWGGTREDPVIPEPVRFLVTTIDVQAGGRPAFVWHTFGIAPVQREDGTWVHDIYHIAMGKIRKSNRLDDDGERKLIDPAAYPEDWDILIPEVIEKTYPLADDSGRRMQVKIIACDSGGAGASANGPVKGANEPKVSVTSNAYAFWNRLRLETEGRGYERRFHLVKGTGSASAPRLYKHIPEAKSSDKFAIQRGNVPVWFINSNSVKDMASAKLGRTEPGGMIHFPLWFDANGDREDIDWLFMQLTTEISTAKGWQNPSRRKNEAWDLLCYCIAICLHPDISIERLNWDRPPSWAGPWDTNDLVSKPDGERRFDPVVLKPVLSMAELAARMG